MNHRESQAFLDQTLAQIAETKTLDERALSSLIAICPAVIALSLDILDSGKITKFQTETSKRRFYRVKETKKK